MMCFLYTSLLLLKNRFAIRLSRTVCQLSLWRPHPFQVGTMYCKYQGYGSLFIEPGFGQNSLSGSRRPLILDCDDLTFSIFFKSPDLDSESGSEYRRPLNPDQGTDLKVKHW